jgi:hypothetical protein
MKFTHQKRQIRLQGIQDRAASCKPVEATKLFGMLKRGSIVDCIQVQPVHQETDLHSLIADIQFTTVPLAIQGVLQEFDDLFGDPVDLPPCRACDHHIPLVP